MKKIVLLLTLIVLVGALEKEPRMALTERRETQVAKANNKPKTTTKTPAWLGRQRGVDGGLMGGGSPTVQTPAAQPAPAKNQSWNRMANQGGGATPTTPYNWNAAANRGMGVPAQPAGNPLAWKGVGNQLAWNNNASPAQWKGVPSQGVKWQDKTQANTPSQSAPFALPAWLKPSVYVPPGMGGNTPTPQQVAAKYRDNEGGGGGDGYTSVSMNENVAGAYNPTPEVPNDDMSLRDYTWRYRRATPPTNPNMPGTSGGGGGGYGGGWGGGRGGFGTNYNWGGGYSSNQPAWIPDMGLFQLNWRG